MLRSVNRPILAGAVFKNKKVGNDQYDVTILNATSNAGGAYLLNSGKVALVTFEGQHGPPKQWNIYTSRLLSTSSYISLQKLLSNIKKESILQTKFTICAQTTGTNLAMLLKSDINGKSLP